MTIKEVSELNYLYDLSGLSLIDLEGEVIFVNDNTVFLNAFSATTNRDVFAPLVREKINSGSNIKNGDIVLITDENFTQKVYLLITIVCGAIVPYPLYLIDYENGNEQIANFEKSDVEMLMGYPMFQDEAELTFFITKMRNIFAVDGSTSNRASIKSLNIFLDKGLWAYQNQYFADTSDIANKLGLKLIGSQPFGTVSGNISIEFFEKDGKYVSIHSDNSGNIPTQLIIGSYELVKQAFCEIALSNSRVLYTPDFGGMFTPMDETLMQKLTDFEASITNLSKPKPIQKTMQEVTDEIVESQENPEPVIDIFAQAEAEFEKAEKETKKEKKKKRQDSFEIKGEITQKEKELAIKETIMDEPKKILIPKKTKKQSSASADKQLEQKLNSTQESYPTDWDYIYTIEETSKQYNYTVGQRYDDINDQMIIDDNQTRGMTIEEWNAYFRAHPELSHLIESTIGHLGGLFMDEKTLIDAGLLLYNPKKMKFDYVHEYVIGNVYKLIEEFEAIKDGFVQTYGESLYEKQLEILLMKRPTLKSISAADPKDVPYIHPLDEVIIDYKINTAANITFTNNQSNRIINSEKKRLEDEIKSGNVDRKDYESLVEEFGGKLQSLSIVVFFRQWLTDQIGKLASYGLPDIEIVDGLYFFGMSYPTYAAEIASRGLVIIPADKEAKDVISYSDYYEAKDSAKRFVNELFQEFLLTQVNEDDRKNIEYAWNKRYNGYVTADVWKLPIFIRHSKYFKDRTKRYKLKYSDIQISGIKFATIDNSSIMAQEVGYGKAEWVENKIFTPTGTKKMGDLQVGDYVIGSNGKPTMVIGTFPQGEKEMYRVTMSDNTSVIVCEDHLWQVQSMRQRSQNKYKKNHYVRTTKEILASGLTYQRKPGHIQKKWSIPITKPVEFEKQDVFVDPYLLGLLIGDGSLSTKNQIGFTTADNELAESVSTLLPNGTKIRRNKTSDIDYGLTSDDNNNPLLIYLRHYNLQGKKSNSKFIPDEYKFNSADVRLAVLQGLMDTDGSATKHQIEYSTVSKQLANDVVFLVQSLGGTARITEKNTTYTYKGEKKEGQLAYRIDVRVPGNIQPFRLKRKIDTYIPKTKYQPTRFITGIEYAGKLEAKCIKVEAQDSLYLTENFIVTHNTLIAIGYMSHCFETGQASNFLVTVPKTLYVNKKWREELVGNMDESRNRYIIGAVPQYNVIELGNFSTSEIFGKGDSKYKAYSKEEKNKISELFDLLKEVESQVINKPYDYKTPVANSKYAWNKLVDTILPNIDKNLMNRSLGKQYLEIKAVLDLLGGFSITQPANPSVKISSKVQNLSILCEKIIELKWFYQKHLPTFGPDVEFKGFAAYDEYTRKQFDKFRDAELPNPFEKDENGKYIWVEKEYFDADGVKQVKEERKRRPLKDLYEEYILSVLSDLQKWAVSVIQKMSDFAIYEFGQWKFSAGTQNIILSTKEALENLGFSSQNISGIVEVVKEITTYKNEDSFDIDKAYSVTFEDEDGKIKQFRRNPEKVMQKQLNDLIDKITQNMTEEGLRGKFFLDNLKIDGFILDEAHIAKKIFTNVKTNAYVYLNLPDGRDLAIRTTSHDIKGGSAPDQALAVFGVCQYIRSIGNRKPIMLLTATPFSNQPTEIFSMLSLVGINQLREYGISNIKNFFDLFLKETLKFDFDHNGDFIKRITVEDFRNKEMLINLIWSVMDIRRESSLDKKNLEEKKFGDKPAKIVFPKLIAESSMETVNLAEEEEDLGLAECEKYGNVNTIAVVNKLSLNTCSIVDQNDIQKKMLGDIEKVVTGDVNPNTQLEYTFDDICPNVAIYNEIEKSKAKVSKSEEEEERETITVALRTILNTNVRQIPNGINVPDYVSAEKALPDMEYNSLVFVENDSVNTGVGKWAIYKKIRTIVTTKTLGQQYSYTKGGKKKTTSYADDVLVKVTDQDTINETLKTLNKKKDYGVTFKALGMSRAIALSPYFFRCNELPEPTAENVVKYSPKLEYLVKSLKSVKDYHLNEIPKRIKDLKDELSQIESIKKPSQDDMDRKSVILKDLPGLEAAREISGQVVYMNMIRFNYYSRTSRGKADVQTFNMAQLLKEYLVKKGWFTDDEVQIISSDTRDKTKEQFIKDFQDGKIKVLFGTPAIKEGVDLQNKASTMYIMTPDWNPTDMRQVEGRIWRRDNENKFVRIVYVLLDQSIEVFIYAKLEEKSRRLQQIMKERNTIEELEEMSLNPNETKVALASDPEKRADIVTKLCQAILFDQRNKVNKSREELNKLTAELDTVYQNLSIIKENYLLPYHEEIPEINKRIYEKQIQNILNVYKNDKPRFIAAFADYTVGAKAPVESRFIAAFADYSIGKPREENVQTNIGFSNPALLDHTLTLALNTIMPSKEVTIDSTLVFFNTNNETLNYLFNAFEVCIQNRDAIIKEAKQNHNGLINASVLSNYITDINEIDIVKFDYRMIDSYLFGGYKYYFSLRIFKLPYIMFAYTDNMRMELMQLLKEIKSKNPHKYEIRNMFENLLVKFNAELNDYAYDSPLIKPENYWPYVDARESKANAKVMITDDKFEAMDLLQKVTVVRDLYYALDGSIQNFIQLSADSKRELLKGKNTNPLLSEVLIKLNLADEDKTVMGDIRNELSELFKPVLRIKNTLQEIEMSFLKARGLSINDLPILAEQQNKDYDAITDKIKALEASRQKLIERFKKASEFRKLVNIDQIVDSFSKSNTYLEKKLSRPV